jgi:hypothetical protein
LTGSFEVPMALLGVMGVLSGVCALAPSLKRPAPGGALATATSS